MTAPDTHQALTEGQTIQWYRVDRVLGRGGFGITYLATDNNLDHRVAIKEYLPASLVQRRADKSLWPVSEESQTQYQEGLQRFLTEARTLVKFRHPNIVRVMAVFEANNTAYLVMEYEEGERFKEAVSKAGGADELILKNLMLSIIDGLEQVHQYGFIHRDIKPVNLIIRNDGSPVLLDFGATRVADGDARHTSFVSVGYTPLEQYQEGASLTVGPWTDIYSLGATLYFAISGETPVSAVSRLAALVKKSPDPLVAATEIGHGRYSDAFLEAIDWALQFKVDDRPQSLDQWRDALQPSTLRSKGPAGTSPVLAARRAAKKTKSAEKKPARKKRWLAILAIPLIAVLAAAGYQYLQEQARQDEYNQLVASADKAFDDGDYLGDARPLYLKVLDAQPQNQHATERLQSINGRVEAAISERLSDGNFSVAEDLINQYAEVEPQRAKPLQGKLQEVRRDSDFQSRFAEAEQQIDSGQYNEARQQLAQLKSDGAKQSRVEALESRIREAVQLREEQQRTLELQREQREQTRINTERRVAEANERQRKRRSDYQRFVSSARLALQNDNVASARKWLESAKAMQINDADLTVLATRVEAAEEFTQKPLTSYEVSYARGQFNALKRAIEVKNLAAINELISPDSTKARLFETLFDRYTQITVQVRDIEAKLNPKRVTAVLRIEKMALPNGDVVYPSASYRDSSLTIERQRYSWSAIQW